MKFCYILLCAFLMRCLTLSYEKSPRSESKNA